MAAIDIDWKPDEKKLKEFGWVSLVGFLVIGLLFLPFVHGIKEAFTGDGFHWAWNWKVVKILGIIGAVIFALSLISTKLVKPIYLFWMAVAFPIGWVISHLILGLLFFGLFTPIAIVFKIMGRDALNRKIDKDAKSYWIERDGKPEAKRYARQF